jgi:hypothetical protein
MAALADFNDGLLRCSLLRQIENSYQDPPATVFEQQSVEVLRAAISVLMVASFEGFVRQLFREQLTLLSQGISGFGLSAYHEHLRVESVLCGLMWAANGPPGAKSRDLQRQGDIIAICTAIAKDEIIVDALSSMGSNPSGKRIVSMLERVGIRAVKEALDKRYRSRFGACSAGYVSDRLDNIVSLRHVVVHTGRIPATVSRVDLDNNLTFLNEAATVINAVLSDFVAAATATAAIPGHKVKRLSI